MSRSFQTSCDRDERGQALVEFAMVIGFLVIFIVGILEVSLFLYNYAVLTDAAKEGVRYAIVHGSSGTNPAGDGGPCGTTTSGGVFAAVQAYAASSIHNLSNMSVNVCYSDSSNTPGNRVQVTVSYPYSPLFLTNWATIPISATSVGRIQF